MLSLSSNTVKLPDQPLGWKNQLADAITSVDELLQLLQLEQLRDKVLPLPAFRFRVPRAYAAKMQTGDARDPLLRQVLPLLAESDTAGATDPVGDMDALMTPGLIQKYHGRALLITTGACAIHCRYCFRRHYPYTDAGCQASNWQQTLDYLHARPDINEVILSGGDPLVLDDERLLRLCRELETIEHLQWLRLHTRLPVVVPARITDSLLQMLRETRFITSVVIHCNHANELGAAEFEALRALRQAGVTLLNQSVLLRGVNDNVDSLVTLSRRLYQAGVLPYYLHMLDPVRGALHFDVDEHDARNMVRAMNAQLPGFLVPRLVREEPGKAGKTAISAI